MQEKLFPTFLGGHKPPKLSANCKLGSSPRLLAQQTYSRQHKGQGAFCASRRSPGGGGRAGGSQLPQVPGGGGTEHRAERWPPPATPPPGDRTLDMRDAQAGSGTEVTRAFLVQSPSRVTPEPAETGRTSWHSANSIMEPGVIGDG